MMKLEFPSLPQISAIESTTEYTELQLLLSGVHSVMSTEYTELQPLLFGVHSVMRVKLALAGEGGGCTPTPSYYIYHHQ